MRQVRVAVVGTGLIGSMYARILKGLPDVELIALCDPQVDAVRALACELQVAAYATSDVDVMLSDRPEIEAVVVCTPDDQHVAPALQVVRAGKHLLLEKPLATNLTDGQRIVAAVTASHVLNMTAHTLRFDPRFAAAHAAVARGDIGDIVYMYARRNNQLRSLARILDGRVSSTFWVGVHDIDMMLWMKGCAVRRVYSRSAGAGFANAHVDQAICSILTFEDGSIAVLETLWLAVADMGRCQQFAFQITGRRGHIEVYPNEVGLAVATDECIVYPDTVYDANLHDRRIGAYPSQIEHFVHSLLAATQPIVSVMDGLAAIEVADAIERSRREELEITMARRSGTEEGGR